MDTADKPNCFYGFSYPDGPPCERASRRPTRSKAHIVQTSSCIPEVLCTCITVASSLPAMAGAARADEQQPGSRDKAAFSVPASERQLFLDDFGIANIENLKRTMHQPVKKGAVIRPTLPGEEALITTSAPQWDPSAKVFKLWLIVSGTGNANGTAYVESKDGIHWIKPALRQKEINGSLENNFVTVDPKREWPANAILNVVFDADDPDPSRRYKGLGRMALPSVGA